MWFQFNSLQWGQVNATFTVAGGEVADGQLSDITGSATLADVQGQGKTAAITGQGGVAQASSSKRRGTVGGSGGSG